MFALICAAEGWNVGGGQMMSCRDMTKIGQLLVNNGAWPDGRGGTTQLISAQYIQEMINRSCGV